MPIGSPQTGPVKAWIEPDRLAFVRAFPGQTAWFSAFLLLSIALAVRVHPLFWVLFSLLVFRQAAMEAHLRTLWREGMLHPARLLPGRRLLATLVRLEGDDGAQDAVVISRIPRRWHGASPPWGGERAAVIIAGEPPALRPLSPDFAVADLERARRAVERIPQPQWDALQRALVQVPLGADDAEGLHPVDLGDTPWYGSVSQIERDGSLPQRLTQDHTSLWCAGLPCIEEVTMVEAERTRVARLRRRAGALLCMLLLAFGGTLGLIVTLARQVGAQPGSNAAGAGLVVLLLVAALPLLGMGAFMQLSRVRWLGRDLRQGKLLRFGGRLSSFDSLVGDRDLGLLVRRGLILAEPGLEQEMVVLPHASMLLYANGNWAPPGVVLHLGRVAEGPELPMKLDLPRELAAESSRPLVVQRRRLLEPERQEIDDHATRLRRPGRGAWFTLAFFAVAITRWESEGLAASSGDAAVPVAVLLVFLTAASTWRRLRLSRKLARDARLGWVLTVDHRRDGPGGLDSELPAQGVESLLHARIDWTVNRRPAAWRRYRGGISRDR